jgi:hypothetical protein
MEIVKQYESFCVSCTKLIKNINNPKITILSPCSFLIQFKEFTRSTDELLIKKLEEFYKLVIIQVIVPTELYLKELSTDENNYIQIITKFQKELGYYKTNLVRLNTNKEKIIQNIEKVKESIQKTSDDPNNFSKFESKLLGLRNEEEVNNEAYFEAFKKHRKYLEDFIESTKKTIITTKEKENFKLTEFRENNLLLMKTEDKIFSQILEFLEFKNQILADAITRKNSLINIYVTFFKENEVPVIEEFVNNVIFDPMNVNMDQINNTYLLNKDETIIFKDYNLLDILKEDELKFYQDKLNFLKSNQMKISMKNVEIRKKYEGIFYISEDETVKSSYSCALADKILLQGKLYLTTKKVVFYSWFNNSTLFGKTLIEIPKDDIVSFKKKERNILFDNELIIETKGSAFHFASFVNRHNCLVEMQELYTNALMNRTDTSIDGDTMALDDRARSCSQVPVMCEEIMIPNFDKSSTNSKILDSNSKGEEYTLNNIPIVGINVVNNDNIDNNGNGNNIGNINNLKEITLIDRIKDTNLFTRLSEMNKARLNAFDTVNKRKFIANFINNLNVGELPVSYIFNSCYNPTHICPELGAGKNFIETYLEMPKNYNMSHTRVDESNWPNKVPVFYANRDVAISCFDSVNSIQDLLLNDYESPNYNQIEFKYNYTHPILKKKFMGPSKLDVEDHFKIYFISPLCLIVEIFSQMSGFMLMDTFYTILQHKFETTMSYDERSDKVVYNTVVNSNFTVEFVKDNWFKNKVLDNSVTDVKEFIDTVMVPCFNRVFENQRSEFKRKRDAHIPRRPRVFSDISNINIEDQVITRHHPTVFLQEEEPKAESQEQIVIESPVSGLQNSINNPKTVRRSSEKLIKIEPMERLPGCTSDLEGSPLFKMLNEYLEIINNDKRILIVATIIICVIMFRYFDIQALMLLFVNIFGFYFIYNKLTMMEKKIIELENSYKCK